MDEKPIKAKPGDLVEYRCDRFGILWQWRILSVCLGAERQESLIEMSPVLARPGLDNAGQERRTVWVPEPLTRHLRVVRTGSGDE